LILEDNFAKKCGGSSVGLFQSVYHSDLNGSFSGQSK